MSISFAGITATGGIPLFSRQIGEATESIPFTTLAALNGVNLFARLNEANLLCTATANTKITWRVFDNSIVLILIITTDPATSLEFVDPKISEATLMCLYDAIVLTCGAKEISNPSIERVKRSLRTAYPLIDQFLRLLFNPAYHVEIFTTSVLTIHLDPTLTEFFKSIAESYCQIADTDLTCITINGQMIGASKGWLTRLAGSKDAFLVLHLVRALASSIGKESRSLEVPVYLPDNCPDSVSRLIISEIYPGCFLIALCGETPTLSAIDESLIGLRSSEAHLKRFKLVHSMKVSALLPVDERVLAFALFRKDRKTILRYGSFDHQRLKELAAFVTMNSESENEQYAKFNWSQAFQMSHHPFTLVVFMSLDYSLTFVRDVTKATLAFLREKKQMAQMM